MSELDPRKQTILRAIIVEYVSAAEPIASEALVQKYELGVRSATVRSAMAEMSDAGYLEQPHTSAGRIPSDMGYRYYVDRLSAETEIEQTVLQKLRDTTAEGDALQEMLRETARALSRLTHLLAVATTVRDQKVTIKTAIVSALGPQQALLVIVLSNGHVENRMLECPAELTLQDVGVVNDQISQGLIGKSLKLISRLKPPLGARSASAEKLIGTIWSAVKQIARDQTRGKLITEGEEFMFAQPEFQRNIGTLNHLLIQLNDSDLLYEAVSNEMSQVVTIGKENRHAPLHQLSIIRRSFSVGEDEAGVIAIIGPTRMNYDRGIPLVNFTARALSSSLTKFFG